MLAEGLGTVERLKQLTIMTYADISAVNPQAMTPWRLEQLWRVYLLAYDELTRELHTERIHDAAGVAPERAAFLEGLISEGKLAFAGPFLDADGKPDGSLVMVEAPDMAAAKALAAADPYAKAGLFESVEIRAWNWVFQKPVGA